MHGTPSRQSERRSRRSYRRRSEIGRICERRRSIPEELIVHPINRDITLPAIDLAPLRAVLSVESQPSYEQQRRRTSVRGQFLDGAEFFSQVEKYGLRTPRGYAAGTIEADAVMGEEVTRKPASVSQRVATIDDGSALSANMVVVEKDEEDGRRARR